jgi:hypothetical protein
VCQPDSLFPIAGFADYLHVWFVFQHAPEPAPD